MNALPPQDPQLVKQRGKWLAEQCARDGFNYSHRIHVELWGDKRGI